MGYKKGSTILSYFYNFSVHSKISIAQLSPPSVIKHWPDLLLFVDCTSNLTL